MSDAIQQINFYVNEAASETLRDRQNYLTIVFIPWLRRGLVNTERWVQENPVMQKCRNFTQHIVQELNFLMHGKGACSMTTDITELAQSLKAAADREMIYRDGAETSEIWERTVTPENILALVEALENSESRLHEVAVACATAEQALEKAQQQTTESENRVRKQNRHICELFDDNTALRQRIAGLESRTVTVKLPKLKMLEDYLAEVAIEERKQILVGVKLEFHRACVAAGIKVEAE